MQVVLPFWLSEQGVFDFPRLGMLAQVHKR